MLGQLIARTYYYFKDLNHVYFACQGLPYGIEDQMLFIDDTPNNAFWNSNNSGLLIEFFKRHKLSNNKVQQLDLCIPFMSNVDWIAIGKDNWFQYRENLLKCTIQDKKDLILNAIFFSLFLILIKINE
jgi:hypothetical protein